VTHRCCIAGAPEPPFDSDAIETLHELSRGNLRAIDRLALEALLLASKASTSVVSSGHVLAAKEQLWV